MNAAASVFSMRGWNDFQQLQQKSEKKRNK